MINYIEYSKMLTVQAEMCLPFEYSFFKKIIYEKMKYVAEIGCGNGYFLKKLKEFYPQAQYEGYDLSEEFIQIAQKSTNDINFQKGSVEHLHQKHDLLILRFIMHQLENRKDFIAEAAQRLSDTSQIIIIDPFDEKFEMSPSLPVFNKHLKNYREKQSPNTANRNIKDIVKQEMNEFGFILEQKNFYYIPSLLTGYKDKYYKYMRATCKIIDCPQVVLDEIDYWYKNSNSYVQIGVFMYCFKRL